MVDIERDFVHLARLALEGRHGDAVALVRKTVRTLVLHRPDLAPAVEEILKQIVNARPTRATATHVLPVDTDSRLELLTREYPVAMPTPPVWSERVAFQLNSIVEERAKAVELINAGIEPTKSALLVGPPGVGKTLAARWLASQLSRPFLTLDLAAVMSSYLGRTGNNIRAVLGYARGTPSVLLLDEFDAIAKRRDDVTEVGELKRLVTVLLQAVDDWPAEGLLLAATNHPELLDPAVWRRFDRIVDFPRPDSVGIDLFLQQQLSEVKIPSETLRLLKGGFEGASFAEIEREVTGAKRQAVVRDVDLRATLEERAYELLSTRAQTRTQRIAMAGMLMRLGLSQREVGRRTGVSRDTLRKRFGRSRTRGRNG